MELNRRVVLSGFMLPAVAGMGLKEASSQSDRREASPAQVPGTDLLTVDEASHDTVLTQETADALSAAGMQFLPTGGSKPVPNAELPSSQFPLTVGATTLDLLGGAVHFDGGFKLTESPSPAADATEVIFTSFASRLSDSVATAMLWRDGEPSERIEALAYDLTTSTIELDGLNLVVTDYLLSLTDQAVEAITAQFPDSPLSADSPFAGGSAAASYLPADVPL